jgi:hypothetical protein
MHFLIIEIENRILESKLFNNYELQNGKNATKGQHANST